MISCVFHLKETSTLAGLGYFSHDHLSVSSVYVFHVNHWNAHFPYKFALQILLKRSRRNGLLVTGYYFYAMLWCAQLFI